jgi:hypothetical protein
LSQVLCCIVGYGDLKVVLVAHLSRIVERGKVG